MKFFAPSVSTRRQNMHAKWMHGPTRMPCEVASTSTTGVVLHSGVSMCLERVSFCTSSLEFTGAPRQTETPVSANSTQRLTESAAREPFFFVFFFFFCFLFVLSSSVFLISPHTEQ